MTGIENGTAVVLYDALLQVLEEYGIPVTKVMGFGSDGASVMVGSQNGVATRLSRNNGHAVAVHCICHRLNLAVSQVGKDIQDVRVR